MAYPPELWAKARGYYESGLSNLEIAKRTGISEAGIRKYAKNSNWYDQSTNSQKKYELEIEHQCAKEVANERIAIARLIYSTTYLNVKRVKEALEKGTVSTEEEESVMFEGKVIPNTTKHKKSVRALTSKDFKDFQDTLDKASLTIGQNPRYLNAPSLPLDGNELHNTTKEIIYIEKQIQENYEQHIETILQKSSN